MSRELVRFVPVPGKMAVMAAGLAVFAALAAWTLFATSAEAWQTETGGIVRAALWVVALLCPLYAADLTVRLARAVPTLVATEDGLVLRAPLGFAPPIRWDEIAGIAAVEMGRKWWLAVYLRDPVATLGRLGLGVRLLHAKSHGPGVPNLAFRAIQLGARPEEAAKVLERLREERAP